MLTNLKKLAAGADDVAQQSFTGAAVGLGAIGIGSSYAADMYGQSVNSRGSPSASGGFANPLETFGQAAKTSAQSAALNMAGAETPGTGMATGTFMASAGAGVATAAYQYNASGTFGSQFKKQFSGKNVFKTTNKGTLGKLFGKMGSKADTAVKGAGNLAYRGLGMAGAAAAGGYVAASVASVAKNTTDRLAQKVLQTGTPGSRLSQNNVMKSTGPRSRRDQSTTSSVNRYAGRSKNVMDGSTVLALHKTGGRGAVLGG